MAAIGARGAMPVQCPACSKLIEVSWMLYTGVQNKRLAELSGAVLMHPNNELAEHLEDHLLEANAATV